MPSSRPTTEGGVPDTHFIWTRDELVALLEERALMRAERERDKALLKGCLDYFRGFDMERADGKTSPVIPKLEDALA